MAGSRETGLKACATNKVKFGDDFYQRIGKMGGTASKKGGFASKLLCGCNHIQSPHRKAQCSGSKGGVASKRRKK